MVNFYGVFIFTLPKRDQVTDSFCGLNHVFLLLHACIYADVICGVELYFSEAVLTFQFWQITIVMRKFKQWRGVWPS